MTAYPFLRHIAGYDLSRLSSFLSAAVRVGISSTAQPQPNPTSYPPPQQYQFQQHQSSNNEER